LRLLASARTSRGRRPAASTADASSVPPGARRGPGPAGRSGTSAASAPARGRRATRCARRAGRRRHASACRPPARQQAADRVVGQFVAQRASIACDRHGRAASCTSTQSSSCAPWPRRAGRWRRSRHASRRHRRRSPACGRDLSSRTGATSRIVGARTTQTRSIAATAAEVARLWWSSGRPASSWYCFGASPPKREPVPAAGTIA
jgi:hypothetical protein